MTRPPIRRVAADVRRGRGGARRQADAAIRRHEASDLGAYIAFDAGALRRQADAIDAAAGRGEDPGPLAGVTVSVKDLYALDGTPLYAGTKRALPAWPEGFLVSSLRRLGAVFAGKTHTVEFAFGGVGLNPNTGTPVNPWDPVEHRAPGGSSAGAGVSLWEGSARIALGTDTGGSIRIPASATGVVGLRPTTGRWPTTGVVPLSTSLDTVGMLAHTVEDLRYAFLALDPLAAAGGEPADPVPEGVVGLRIGVPASRLWTDADSGIAAVVNGALEELRVAGADVLELDAPELDDAGERYLSGPIVQPEFVEFLQRELPDWIPLLDPIIGTRLEAAGGVPALEYIAAHQHRRALSAGVHARLAAERIDLLAAPTLPISPPPLPALGRLDAYRKANRAMLSGTCPASMLDMCAISLPAGLDGEGMPVGLQLMGPSGADLRLLAQAAAAEEVLGTNLTRLGTPPRVAG
ncbi:MAG: amidase [Gemmatimonadales bacterium]|uniref:amidase n=1 Tax=Candidatus Palauibacter irciniicola TaxID=3056733 RepID=UPI00138449B9|nr:amidase [Candidatus Palauibacter irciniicola]MYC19528.1 amidase [Gemmatimonadales bacterium]